MFARHLPRSEVRLNLSSDLDLSSDLGKCRANIGIFSKENVAQTYALESRANV